jgi:hypothetical protein
VTSIWVPRYLALNLGPDLGVYYIATFLNMVGVSGGKAPNPEKALARAQPITEQSIECAIAKAHWD